MNTKLTNPKRKAILEAARRLFWKHGFKRVTVEEVCREAGISKMTFYRHFENKIDLAKAVYEKVAKDGIMDFKRIMMDESMSTSEKMEAMLLIKLEGSNEISREFLNDFYSSPELGLSAFVEEISLYIWSEIINDFKAAQERGWLRKDFKPEVFFMMTGKIIELVSDERVLKLYKTPQEVVMELAKLFTYGIIPRKGG